MVTIALVAAEENRVFPGLPEMSGETVALANPPSGESPSSGAACCPVSLRALDENLRHGEPLVAGFSHRARLRARERQLPRA